jgi:elongation factor 2
MVICITNVLIEKDEQVVVGRIFAGTVSSGDRVYLLTSKQEAQVENVLLFMGATRETVDQLTAGNIVGLTGLSSLRAGETIVSPDFAAQMTPFARIEVTQPVMTVAIEPADPRNLHRIAEGMEKLTLSDPSTVTSISKETGEHLLGGMGELQLEIAVKSLKKISGVADLKVSPPTVNYRECTGQVGKTARATNQRRTITMAVQVRPAIQTDKSDSQNHRWTEDSKGNLLSSQMEPDKAGHWRDYIISSFKSFCMAGPLCNEPITNLEIIIVNAKISETSENSEDVMAVFGRAAYGSILTASPTLLEPIYRIKMLAHTEFVGRCTRIIVQKRGRVSGIEQRGSNTLIMGYVPVAETFGMPTTLRSSTSGQASWQWSFDNWQELPDDLANRLIRQLRVKKGLPPEIPKPQSFALIE